MLNLPYKQVAQRNIDEFDRLGAFNGATGCVYHYYKDEDGGDILLSHGVVLTNFGCAIGICDTDRLLACENYEPIRGLVGEIVETDNVQRLSFIQMLHDYKTGAERTFTAFLNGDAPCPGCVRDLCEGIKNPDDLTPEIYKEIMRRLVEE